MRAASCWYFLSLVTFESYPNRLQAKPVGDNNNTLGQPRLSSNTFQWRQLLLAPYEFVYETSSVAVSSRMAVIIVYLEWYEYVRA